MARTVNRLSARGAATLKEPGRHADGAGLNLVINEKGAKSWVLIFQFDKKRKEMGLGSASLVSLAEAREAALAARKLIAAGKNPIAERDAERARTSGVTFGDVADDLVESLKPQWKNAKHAAQWKTTLSTHAGDLRPIPVALVTTEDVLAVLKPIWSKTPETATRTRGRIERVLDAAKAKGLRTGENPARWRGHLALLLPRRQGLSRGHHPALPFEEIGAFMALVKLRPATAARALELTILTAARFGEIFGIRWSEIDFDKAVWTVPADRMKGKVEHRVPLSTPALQLLANLHADEVRAGRGGDKPTALAFPGARGDRPLSNMAMEMLLRRMDRNDITVHGFRSSFRDWAGETTEYPREVIEAALAHVVGSKVERAYRRGDALEKRRRLLEDWATYCGTAPKAMTAAA